MNRSARITKPPKPLLNKNSLINRMWQHKVFYIFLLPALLCLTLFGYRPFMWLVMAFQDYKLGNSILASQWVGFQNFIDVFKTPDFYSALKNTFGINGLAFLLGFPAPIILALMINEVRSIRFKKSVQTLTYLPHFLSWVIVAGLFYLMLDEDMGIINAIINGIGFDKIPFLREAKYFWTLIISTSIWKEIGYGSIIYLAALTSIDPALYEAARVDGATKWQQIKNVTIPGIVPTISIMLILTAGKIAKGGGLIPGFDAILNMQNPMLFEKAQTLQVLSYFEGIVYYRYAYAAAIGIIESLVAFMFVFGSNYLAKKFRGYGLF